MHCDIDLKLSGDDHRGYFVEVLDSPLTRTEPLPLLLPAGLADRIQIVRNRRGDRLQSKRLGIDLFTALLPTPVRNIWYQCKGRAREDGVLRLRLDIRADGLRDIPWEMIHDGKEFLTLSPRYPVVRYLLGDATLRPVEGDGPLNVLLISSTPRDMRRLPGVKRELELVRDNLKGREAGRKIARVDTLEHATPEKLRASLNAPYHIVHYMGHGAFIKNRGYLILEDETGNSTWNEAETVGDLLRGKAIRLLVLNACDTAIPSAEESLIGVAHAAHAAGVPAVIAMQQAILDSAAAEFASAFYQTLIAIQPLETCLSAGRSAAKAKLGPDSSDWAIPVMFSNAPAGSLWGGQEKKVHQEPSQIIDFRGKAEKTIIAIQGAGGTIKQSNK